MSDADRVLTDDLLPRLQPRVFDPPTPVPPGLVQFVGRTIEPTTFQVEVPAALLVERPDDPRRSQVVEAITRCTNRLPKAGPHTSDLAARTTHLSGLSAAAAMIHHGEVGGNAEGPKPNMVWHHLLVAHVDENRREFRRAYRAATFYGAFCWRLHFCQAGVGKFANPSRHHGLAVWRCRSLDAPCSLGSGTGWTSKATMGAVTLEGLCRETRAELDHGAVLRG